MSRRPSIRQIYRVCSSLWVLLFIMAASRNACRRLCPPVYVHINSRKSARRAEIESEAQPFTAQRGVRLLIVSRCTAPNLTRTAFQAAQMPRFMSGRNDGHSKKLDTRLMITCLLYLLLSRNHVAIRFDQFGEQIIFLGNAELKDMFAAACWIIYFFWMCTTKHSVEQFPKRCHFCFKGNSCRKRNWNKLCKCVTFPTWGTFDRAMASFCSETLQRTGFNKFRNKKETTKKLSKDNKYLAGSNQE